MARKRIPFRGILCYTSRVINGRGLALQHWWPKQTPSASNREAVLFMETAPTELHRLAIRSEASTENRIARLRSPAGELRWATSCGGWWVGWGSNPGPKA